MDILDIFQSVRRGDVRRINSEYEIIQQEAHDRLLGSEMMRNDLQSTLEIWETIERTMLELFQQIEYNNSLKNEIIGQLHLTPQELEDLSIPPVGLTKNAKALLDNTVLLHYKRAYDAAVGGDIEAYRRQAMDYRLTSGLENYDLSALLQRIEEITAYVDLDNLHVKHLWKIYQNRSTERLRELLYPAIANRIIQNGNLYVDAYINFVSTLERQLRKGCF